MAMRGVTGTGIRVAMGIRAASATRVAMRHRGGTAITRPGGMLPPPPPEPPLSPAQQQLKYLYEHRDQINQLPPQQQQQVIKRARELLKRQ